MEFIGLSVEQVLAILQEQGCAYHIFEDGSISYLEHHQSSSADWMLQVFGQQPHQEEWSEYADGQIIVEFEDGVCVEHYQEEDWD